MSIERIASLARGHHAIEPIRSEHPVIASKPLFSDEDQVEISHSVREAYGLNPQPPLEKNEDSWKSLFSSAIKKLTDRYFKQHGVERDSSDKDYRRVFDVLVEKLGLIPGQDDIVQGVFSALGLEKGSSDQEMMLAMDRAFKA